MDTDKKITPLVVALIIALAFLFIDFDWLRREWILATIIIGSAILVGILFVVYEEIKNDKKDHVRKIAFKKTNARFNRITNAIEIKTGTCVKFITLELCNTLTGEKRVCFRPGDTDISDGLNELGEQRITGLSREKDTHARIERIFLEESHIKKIPNIAYKIIDAGIIQINDTQTIFNIHGRSHAFVTDESNRTITKKLIEEWFPSAEIIEKDLFVPN